MKKPLKTTLIILFVILAILFIFRANTPREIDDLTPGILCEQEYLEKSDVLWVIPNYNNSLISENPEWCKEILALNKTLGMHGVRHYYKEFQDNLTQEYLNQGIYAFEKCFGYKPTMFKPPQLALSKENEILLQKNNLTTKKYSNQILHKVYHCNDTGTLPNWFHDVF